MKKHLTKIIVLSLIVMYAFAIKIVNAEEINISEEIFTYENGNYYYYVDGIKQKGPTQIGEDKYFLGENTGRLLTNCMVTAERDRKTYYAGLDGKLAKGFQDVNGTTYYFSEEDNTMQKGPIQVGEDKYFLGENTGRLLKNGLITAERDGKSYYAGPDGKLVKGFRDVNGTTYYFSEEDNTLQKGPIQIGEDKYFLGENTGRLLKNGLITAERDRKTYYATASGKLAKGFQDVNGTTYYFSEEDNTMQKGPIQIEEDKYFLGENTGRLLKNGLITAERDGKSYYAGPDGKLVKGFQEVKGTTYYFSEEDNTMQKGPIQVGEDKYFLGENTGRLLKNGLITAERDGKSYYAGPDGKLVKGFQEVKGTTYYFSEEDNTLQKGPIQIEEDKYFLGENTGRLLKNGLITAERDGKIYYATANGKLAKGFQEVKGTTYYFSEIDNTMQKGPIQIGEDKYFLGENTGRLLTNGWITAERDGKRYYAGSDGRLVKGFYDINNVTYLFNDECTLYNGFYDTEDNRYYYIDGISQKGATWVGEDRYFFGENTGRLLTNGWITAERDGQIYYAGSDGKLYRGLNVIDEKTYFFGEYTGRLLIGGWITAAKTGKIYYSDSEGLLLKGDQFIDNNWYTFKDDYSLNTGWQTINGKTYYFYADGTKAKYFAKIAGVRYEFSTTGELQHSNIKIIADISFHNGWIDWDTLWNSGEIDGVILRIGYSLGMDRIFVTNLSEVKRLGIPYSVYHFSIAENSYEAQNEANYLVSWFTNNSVSPVYGVFYDIESWYNPEDGHSSDGITKSDYDSIISTYKSTLNNNGINMSLYTGKNYAETRLSDYGRDQIGWIAHYATDCGYQGSYRGWQYTSKGRLPGIYGDVDLSVFYY